MLLISQAVRSNLPLGEAIRLLVNGDTKNRTNRSLLRFALLLDEGVEPVVAVRKANLPHRLAVLLETAFKSGNFPDYFAELTETERNRSQTFQTLSNLLAYPLLLCAFMPVILGLMVLIAHQFEIVFWDFDWELPAITLMMITLSHTMLQPLTYIILLGGMIIFILLQQLFFPSFWFYIPILGSLFRSLASQKLLRQLSFSLNRGLPTDQALKLAAGSFLMNRAYRKNCLRAAAWAKEGTQFSLLVSFFPLLFPQWLIPFIQTAEKKNAIPSALKHGVDILEKDQSGIAFLFALFFVPFIYFILLSFLIFVVIAMFLPFIKLVTALSG
ncbi:MAG: type II secretion system F family protein [Planctomycetaceae bacterium]|nr:type II secretion system F family protein [Planctomycetaceae bacterium]